MTAFSDWAEHRVLEYFLRSNVNFTPQTTYVALYLTSTTDADGGTEVPAANSYARTSITWGEAQSPGGTCNNSVAITFPQATGDWGTVTHISIRDRSTGGNSIFHGALANSKVVQSGDTFTIPAGALLITLA